ncbi:MAG: LamG domain-containing protein [Bacteroidetes bacterium]|nr:LamG domain-containing protein [Bacteroidota bacterium]
MNNEMRRFGIAFGLILAMTIVFALSCSDDVQDVDYPTAGLVSYFPFDENLSDVNGNTPGGVNIGGATFTSGKSGQALTLNGTSQYAVFNSVPYHSGDNVSLSLWFKTFHHSGTRFMMYCDEFGASTNNEEVTFYIYLPGVVYAEGFYQSNTWTHFVGTYDGTFIRTYLNGNLSQEFSFPGNLSNSSNQLILGHAGAVYWAGQMDELFIYNKALGQAEVTQLYEQ